MVALDEGARHHLAGQLAVLEQAETQAGVPTDQYALSALCLSVGQRGRGAVGGIAQGGARRTGGVEAETGVEEAALLVDDGRIQLTVGIGGQTVAAAGRGCCRPCPCGAAVGGEGQRGTPDGRRIALGEDGLALLVGQHERAALALQLEGGLQGVDVVAAHPDLPVAMGRQFAECIGNSPFLRLGWVVAQVAATQRHADVAAIVELYPAVEVEGRTHHHVDIGGHHLVQADAACLWLNDLGEPFQAEIVEDHPVVGPGHRLIVVQAEGERALSDVELHLVLVGPCREGHLCRLHGVGEEDETVGSIGAPYVLIEVEGVLTLQRLLLVVGEEIAADDLGAVAVATVGFLVGTGAIECLHADAVVTVGHALLPVLQAHKTVPHLHARVAHGAKGRGLSGHLPVAAVGSVELWVLQVVVCHVNPLRLGSHPDGAEAKRKYGNLGSDSHWSNVGI